MGCSQSDLNLREMGWMFCEAESENNSTSARSEHSAWREELNRWNAHNQPQEGFWELPSSLTHPIFPQIAKDISRTFPDSPFLSAKANSETFQKVLRKFALYFPRVGYTQGLNFVAGHLLLFGLDGAEAFRLLVRLMLHERILAVGLYEDGFLLNQFYCECFWQLLERKIPRVYQRLRKIEIRDQNWLFKWFISFFLYGFPQQIARSFWDYIVCKKHSLVLIALGVIKCLKNEILSSEMKDQFDFYELVSNLESTKFCMERLDGKKIIAFANSFQLAQIDKAMAATTCLHNPYRKYFTSSEEAQKVWWGQFLNKINNERYLFSINPEPKRYERSEESVGLIQRLILSKHKLYNSHLEDRGSWFKLSTYSIQFQDSSYQQESFCKKKNVEEGTTTQK